MAHRYMTWDEAVSEGYVQYVLDGARGIYLPQAFAEGHTLIHPEDSGADPEDIDILRTGPNHKHYWDAWDAVLDAVEYDDGRGRRWQLYHDDDLFALCVQDGGTDIDIDWD